MMPVLVEVIRCKMIKLILDWLLEGDVTEQDINDLDLIEQF